MSLFERFLQFIQLVACEYRATATSSMNLISFVGSDNWADFAYLCRLFFFFFLLNPLMPSTVKSLLGSIGVAAMKKRGIWLKAVLYQIEKLDMISIDVIVVVYSSKSQINKKSSRSQTNCWTDENLQHNISPACLHCAPSIVSNKNIFQS